MPARYHIILAREAVSDLQSLHDYIARDSPENAAKIVERILKSIFSLDSFPHRNLAERRSQKIEYPGPFACSQTIYHLFPCA
jgi:plasmid stabilization system protein ParE